MQDMMTELLIECSDGLDLIDRHLVALESDPTDATLLTEVFRAIHTIKGSCGFHGLNHTELVAHSAEDLLSALREGRVRFDRHVADALLATADMIRAILGHVERTGEEGATEVGGLTSRLDALAAGEAVETSGPDGDDRHIEPWPDADPLAEEALDAAPHATSGPNEPADIFGRGNEVGDNEVGDNEVGGDDGVDRLDVDPVPTGSAAARTAAVDTSIRVDVRLLDELVNLVGELVLSRNEMVRLANEHEDTVFGPPSQQLNLITSELQERVMKTRMQPISSAWSKLPRVVRDLSLQLGKEISIEMTGQETELDRTIIESIRDPLTHIVRNVVDHGIEAPDDRLAAGKPRHGTLHLSAAHQGQQVVIVIADDGRGIDPDRVLATAIERGVVTEETGAQLEEAEVLDLVFRPGFSTASAVTNVSGRGVGMDVVRSNVERIGGAVELRSEVGRGTTVIIKIPLTLAIIPALTVRAGEGRYAIGQVDVLELVRLRDGSGARIEDIHGAAVYRLRGRLLPIVDLRAQLGLGPIEQRITHIVVVQTEAVRFGLVVDAIEDNGEIVVKPLGHHLKDLPLFAGATIAGDGSVALILDLAGLADRAGLLAPGSGVNDDDGAAGDGGPGLGAIDAEALIVLSVGDGERVAISLAEIDRLEEIGAASIERSEGRPVVQYRGSLMPLLDLGQVIGLGGSALGDNQRVKVVVCLSGGRTIGLAVDEIVDIVHADAVQPTGKPGTIIVDGQVTDMVAPATVIAAALPGHRVDEPAGVGLA